MIVEKFTNAIALEDYETPAGEKLFEKGETYKVKEYCDRFFYPAKAKHKTLIPKGILQKIGKEQEDDN